MKAGGKVGYVIFPSFSFINNIALDSSSSKHITLKDNCFTFTAPNKTIDKKHVRKARERSWGKGADNQSTLSIIEGMFLGSTVMMSCSIF